LTRPKPSTTMKPMSWIETTSDGVRLHIRVVPRASRNGVQGLLGDAVKIRLQAPPVEGKANRALLDFLAEALKLPARQLELLSGETGRNKTVLVHGRTEAEVRGALRL